MDIDQVKTEKREAQLREWKAKLEQLQAKADQATADAKIQYQQEVDKLRGQFGSLQSRLSELKSSSDAALGDMKSGFQSAWNEFSAALKQASARFESGDCAGQSGSSCETTSTPRGACSD